MFSKDEADESIVKLEFEGKRPVGSAVTCVVTKLEDKNSPGIEVSQEEYRSGDIVSYSGDWSVKTASLSCSLTNGAATNVTSSSVCQNAASESDAASWCLEGKQMLQ